MKILSHTHGTVREMCFLVRGDPTASRRLQFLRHNAELQIYLGKQHVPALQQIFLKPVSPETQATNGHF